MQFSSNCINKSDTKLDHFVFQHIKKNGHWTVVTLLTKCMQPSRQNVRTGIWIGFYGFLCRDHFHTHAHTLFHIKLTNLLSSRSNASYWIRALSINLFAIYLKSGTDEPRIIGADNLFSTYPFGLLTHTICFHLKILFWGASRFLNAKNKNRTVLDNWNYVLFRGRNLSAYLSFYLNYSERKKKRPLKVF